MITIIVDTKEECDYMMHEALNYICSKTPFNQCLRYHSSKEGGCDNCYRENHIKCGIRVIHLLDNDADN